MVLSYLLLMQVSVFITKTCPCNIQKPSRLKKDTFRMKNCDIFLIFAQIIEAVLTSTHNQSFRVKIRKKCIPPVNPSFTIQKWGVRGYSLHGLVSMMFYTFAKQNRLCDIYSPV